MIALKDHAKHIKDMNVEIYLSKRVHPDVLDAVEKEPEVIAKYDDQLEVIKKYFEQILLNRH